MCSYQQPKDDNFDWTRDAGGTSSGGTGPSKDHTLGTSKHYYRHFSIFFVRKEWDREGKEGKEKEGMKWNWDERVKDVSKGETGK